VPGRSTDPALPRISRPLDTLLGEPVAPAAALDRLGDVLARGPRDPGRTRPGEAGRLSTRFKDFEGPEIKPEFVQSLADRLLELDTLPLRGTLDALSGAIFEMVIKDSPEFLPREPLAEGTKGARLPLPAPVLQPLVARAAMEMHDGAEQVLWDDGINQLIVNLRGMATKLAPRRITVVIPVVCDQTDTKMSVPFATGGEGRNAGMVLATADRPVGDALIARIWGEALIALARGALLSVVGAMAGASGRDERNDRLVPRALLVDDGVMVVETEAQRHFRRTLK
jgi:hypothetical protein